MRSLCSPGLPANPVHHDVHDVQAGARIPLDDPRLQLVLEALLALVAGEEVLGANHIGRQPIGDLSGEPGGLAQSHRESQRPRALSETRERVVRNGPIGGVLLNVGRVSHGYLREEVERPHEGA
jgi:hypothetical protein